MCASESESDSDTISSRKRSAETAHDVDSSSDDELPSSGQPEDDTSSEEEAINPHKKPAPELVFPDDEDDEEEIASKAAAEVIRLERRARSSAARKARKQSLREWVASTAQLTRQNDDEFEYTVGGNSVKRCATLLVNLLRTGPFDGPAVTFYRFSNP